ncbi:MAG: hypothetical protein COB38_11075 [Gammaproteobacteria bacterium]|nr:MAG: hypothetical protein COB38_11075 [Gammaproteobacteria bacterium]
MNQKEQILLDYLEHKSLAIKEYELMTDLQENTKFFSKLGEDASLFKKHFYLFHHLYLLAEALKEQSFELEISALSIKLCKKTLTSESKKEGHVSEYHVSEYKGEIVELQNFYLNSDNLNLPDEEVQDMLALFWKRYLAIDKKSDAIKCFGLEEHNNLSRSQIKKRYNQLASQYHPDKGGDKIKFMQIKEAYEQLKELY